MGADYVINHHKNLKSQIKEIIGIDYAHYILCLKWVILCKMERFLNQRHKASRPEIR